MNQEFHVSFLYRNKINTVRTLVFFFLSGLLLCLLQTGAGFAEVDEKAARFKAEAYKYYHGAGKPRNYTKALNMYKAAALRGDAEAQFVLGGMLYKGLGGEQDERAALKWLLKAAQQGKSSAESMQVIGSMYLRGNGVPQSYVEAKKWLDPAAEQGNLAALTDLAFIYYNGLDGEQDLKKALQLYLHAAYQGDTLAQANVGMMYANGFGTAIDRAVGYAWYSLAASGGNTSARIGRNALMADMSGEELNQAQAISVALYQKIQHMEQFQGTPEAQGE
ncbi:MAG: hypothetical protein CSA31_00115 [Desulfobulbus propionicus]|nr:MAG: hypothetical protein CSB34_03195 [Desulfobulbus propionicus]PIE60813.1 MAG: hypothetical protein CSA31_00115 [Desulfobulbus propionicus]